MAIPDPQRWGRVQAMFERALELPPEQRSRWLEEAAIDPGERAEVETLLRAHEEVATGFLASPPALSEEDALAMLRDPLIGRELGHWRIVRELARGGMGTVYLAERIDDFQKQAAIKVVKRGMDSDEVLRRFRYERQLLARLEHPNVARILDGGATAERLPYIVMDYIEGAPIDVWCTARRLPLERRLELFLEVCGAVSYAHRHLVVHRDLKPANIVVRESGAPVLLDFGIAKVLDPELVEGTAASTQLGGGPMTPEYASPEQLLGQPVTTASDIYSLGVILHELLTGARLFRIEAPTAETLYRLATSDVPPPSARAGRDLARRLRGDLDTIVLRALEKEPARRYASVDALAEDVRRHLTGRPIAARAPRWSYRAAKFVRRHRVGVGAAVVLATVIVAAAVITVQQRIEAERQQKIAMDAANTMVLEVADAMTRMSGPTEARIGLLSDAQRIFERLEGSGDRREVRLRLAETNRLLAQTYAYLGDAPRALQRVESAESFLRPALERDPSVHELSTLGTIAMERGDILTMLQRGRETSAAYDAAIALLRRASTRADATINVRSTYAVALTRKADRLFEEGQYAAAEPLFREARDLLARLVTAAPANTVYGSRYAMAVSRIADCMYYGGKTTESCVEYRKALDIQERVLARAPTSTNLLRSFAIYNQYCGYCAEIGGNIPEAIALYGKGVEVQRRLVAHDPSNTLNVQQLMAGLAQLASTHQRAGQYDRAVALLDESAAAGKAYRNRFGVAPSLVATGANNDLIRAETLSRMGRHSDAAQAMRSALSSFELLRERDPSNVDHLRDIVSVQLSLVGTARRSGSRAAAREHAARAVDLARRLAASGAATDIEELARALHELGAEELARGNRDAARKAAEEGLHLLRDRRARGLLDPGSQAAREYLPGLEKLSANIR